MGKIKFRWKEVLKVAIPIALIALPFIAPTLVTTVGTALTVEGASAATIQAVGQAAITGGAQLALGKSPEEAARAAAASFIGSEVSSLLPSEIPKPVSTGIGRTAGALVAGASPEQALQQGVVSGITSAVLPPPAPDASLGDVALYTAGRTGLTQGLSELLKPKPRTPSAPSGGGTTATQPSSPAFEPATGVTTTGAGAAPGSAALAQALRTDFGAPIFGGEKEKGAARSGWNVESLRYMGNSGEA